MIEYSPLGVGGFMPPHTTSLTHVSDAKCPHRLVAQDEALSRLKPGFEFPWGHLAHSLLPQPSNRWRLHGVNDYQIWLGLLKR